MQSVGSVMQFNLIRDDIVLGTQVRDHSNEQTMYISVGCLYRPENISNQIAFTITETKIDRFSLTFIQAFKRWRKTELNQANRIALP